jgi:hypothetical protein
MRHHQTLYSYKLINNQQKLIMVFFYNAFFTQNETFPQKCVHQSTENLIFINMVHNNWN